MGLFDFFLKDKDKNLQPKIKPEWVKKGFVDEDEFLEENFSPKAIKLIKEADEEESTGIYIYQYFANPSLQTPLEHLVAHDAVVKGETMPEMIGEPTGYLEDGTPFTRHGFWSQTTQFALDGGWGDAGELTGTPTDIGRIKQSSKFFKDWMNYLIDFRTIVESDLTIEEKLYQINDVVSQKSTAYKKIYKKLVVENNFPDSFFSYLLTELNGIGATTAGLLWDAGYLTKEQVLNAPDEELIQIKGIGKKLVEKIKSKK